jgi:uncharacterized protein (DUF1501 family)
MALYRRDMLRLAVVGLAHPLLPMRGIVSQVFAAPGAADAKFLLVFLRGGYDAANVIIPIGSSAYYELRPTIAIPKPNPNDPLGDFAGRVERRRGVGHASGAEVDAAALEERSAGVRTVRGQ